MSETHSNHMVIRKNDAIQLPKEVGGLTDYFEQRAIVDPDFAGFVYYASQLEDQIKRIAYLNAAHEDLTLNVELSPAEDPLKLYKNPDSDSYGTVASTALIELAYRVTDARLRDSEGWDYIPHGRVWYQGRHLGRPIQFIENFDYDEQGEFKTLDISTSVPREMLEHHLPLQGQDPDSHFYTTGETIEEVVDLYNNTLNVIPTAPIDEAEVVKGWIERRAA
jgi:hypothetical protein